MKTVTLYTKLGCHLCEAAESIIATVGRQQKFHFVRRDITEDSADFDKYKHDIPVVMVDGAEVARHRLTPEQLMMALAIASPGR